VYPDDTHRDLATVLSYLTGRTLTKEEIWSAMHMSRSTHYDRLEKGTLITADNLRTAAANLGINRAELLTRYRLADLEEVTALAECIGSRAVTRLPCNLPRPSGLCAATLCGGVQANRLHNNAQFCPRYLLRGRSKRRSGRSDARGTPGK
jgi:hypothetical protein